MNDPLQYSLLADTRGKPLDGGKYYRFHLPASIPSCNFWSMIVYDRESGSMITTDQSWPSVYSNYNSLEVNRDGSVDAWFGPESPPGREHNWIKTIPGKNWYLILRLYDIHENGYDKSWRPCEIEEYKRINGFSDAQSIKMYYNRRYDKKIKH